MVANTYLEGTYTSFIRTSRRTKRACKSCSSSSRFPAEFPAMPRRKRRARSTKAANWAIPSLMPMARSSIIPTCWSCCVVGDGEAETGPLATSWHSNKFLNPARDGAVLPDSASERLQDCQSDRAGAHSSDEELTQLFSGYGYKPYFVEGHEPELMHQLMAATLDTVDRRDHARFRRTRATNGSTSAACLADDRHAHAQRLDRPEGSGRQAGRRTGARTRCRSTDLATNPDI